MNEKKGRKRINRKKKKEATGKVNLRNKNTVKEKDKIISENKEQTKKYTRRGKKRRNKTQVNSFSLNRCHNSPRISHPHNRTLPRTGSGFGFDSGNTSARRKK